MQKISDRANLSGELATTLRGMILEGSMPAGARINEVHLAAKLGVSRTPLREALMRLASEGAVTVMPRVGFFVCPLAAEEVENLYPIRAVLDPAALRIGGIPSAAKLKALKSLNRRFAKAADPMAAVRLDDEWHLQLLEHCPNTILLDLIQQFMWRTRRYELGMMRARVNLQLAATSHDKIIAALEADDLDRACEELAANLSSGKDPILQWLSERERTKEKTP